MSITSHSRQGQSSHRARPQPAYHGYLTRAKSYQRDEVRQRIGVAIALGTLMLLVNILLILSSK